MCISGGVHSPRHTSVSTAVPSAGRLPLRAWTILRPEYCLGVAVLLSQRGHGGMSLCAGDLTLKMPFYGGPMSAYVEWGDGTPAQHVTRSLCDHNTQHTQTHFLNTLFLYTCMSSFLTHSYISLNILPYVHSRHMHVTYT